MSTIAFLGTGLLGSAFVEAACGRGDTVRTWNRTRAKAERLMAFGATVHDTPAEAVRGAERVHLVLQADASVDEVIGALRPGLAPGAVIVDHTTTLPAATAARAARLEAQHLEYLHCPVFIGPPAARKGEGIIMACGPRARFERVRPALERQAQRLEYLGERPDLAAVYKLCGNALIIGLGALVADVLSIGAAEGVAPADTMKLMDFFNAQGIVTGRGRRMAAGDFEATFELTMARKDVGLMVETAGPLPLAMLPALAARMEALIAAGHGQQDLGVLAADAIAAARAH